MHFTLKPDDMARMQRFAMGRVLSSMPNRSLVFGLRVLAWFAIALAFFNLLKAYEYYEDAQHSFQLAGYGAVAAIVLLGVTSYLQRAAFAKGTVTEGGWFLSQQSVQVSEDGLQHGSKLGTFSIPWSAFVWRAEDERNFYLFVDQGIGFAFPKVAIPDNAKQALLRTKVSE
jgi:hypothetical protein